MKSTAALLFLICTNAFAHDTTNWLTDIEAFQYTKNAIAKGSPTPLPFNETFENIQIDRAFLKDKLAEFLAVAPERSAAANRELARKFLAQEYSKLGFQISTHAYGSGANFIAEKVGRDPSKVLILSSHIDSVGNAGANDNGTGTIGNLTIAKALAEHQFKYTLRVIGFDEEELSNVGSRAYTAGLTAGDKAMILGAINFEMMGTNGRKDGGFHVIDCDRQDSAWLSQKVMGAATSLSHQLIRVPACTNRSDHASFWDAGVPAIVISENFFGGDYDQCYHRTCDVLDSRLDFNYMGNITDAVATAVVNVLVRVK